MTKGMDNLRKAAEEAEKLREEWIDSQIAVYQAGKKLEEENIHDTGIPDIFNRREFDKRIIRELVSRGGNRKYSPFALVMIDVDLFKGYNDAEGHPKGDRALKEVAHTLDRYTRPIDDVFRYGGDEFAIIMPETGPQEAFDTCTRVCKDLDEYMTQAGINLTVSMGITTYPDGAKTPHDILVQADQNLYKAKNLRDRSNTNSFVYFELPF